MKEFKELIEGVWWMVRLALCVLAVCWVLGTIVPGGLPKAPDKLPPAPWAGLGTYIKVHQYFIAYWAGAYFILLGVAAALKVLCGYRFTKKTA